MYPESDRWKTTATPASASRAQTGSCDGSPNDRGLATPGTGAGRTHTSLAPRPMTNSASSTAFTGSASEMIGAEMKRPSGRSNPQSSSSHRLKACTEAMVASISCLRPSSTPQANVGSMNTVSRCWRSSTCSRASRFWYSGCSESRSTFINDAGSTPSGISPRNSRSRQPGSMIGSKVGLGMKWLTVPPNTASVRLPSCTICTPRLLNSLGRCRVKASIGS